MIQDKKDNRIITIITTLMVMVYAAISYFTPYQMDDLHYYLIPFKDYFLGSGPADFSSYTDFLDAHYRLVNGRLSNLLAPLILTFLPKAVFALATGTAVAITVYFIASVGAGGKRPSPLLLLLSLLLSTFLLPWHSGAMFGGDYSINYLWTSALAVSATYLFLFGKRTNTSFLIGCSILAFISGAFHEGISAPLLGAMGIYIITDFKNTRRIQYTIFIAMTLGFLLPLCSPALWMRAEKENTIFQVPTLKLAAMSAAFILYCIMLMTAFCMKRWRQAIAGCRKEIIFYLVASVISGCFLILFYSGARTFWCGLMMSVTGICALAHCFPYTFGYNNILREIAGGIIVGILCTHFSYVIIWQKKIESEYIQVLNEFKASPDGAIYHDIIKPEDIPAACNKKVSYRVLAESWQMRIISRMYGNGKLLSIIPCELQNPDTTLLKQVGYNPDIYLYKNHILTPDHNIGSREGNRDEERFEIHDASGRSHGMSAIVQHLPHSPIANDTTTWYLLRPAYNSTGADSSTSKIEWMSRKPPVTGEGTEYYKHWG